MTLTIRHATQSNVQDEGVPGEIGPNEWNEGHTITGVLVNQFVVGDGSGGVALRAIVGTDLPNPSVLDRGGIFAVVPVSKKWVAYIDTNGQPQLTQPASGDVSCSATNANAGSSGARLPPECGVETGASGAGRTVSVITHVRDAAHSARPAPPAHATAAMVSCRPAGA